MSSAEAEAGVALVLALLITVPVVFRATAMFQMGLPVKALMVSTNQGPVEMAGVAVGPMWATEKIRRVPMGSTPQRERMERIIQTPALKTVKQVAEALPIMMMALPVAKAATPLTQRTVASALRR
jgi:hypothetical protein